METRYCPNCMQVMGNGTNHRLCPNCGFNFAANPQPQNALPWYTRLNNRYIVGRVLGQGGFGLTYVGFDTNLQCKVAIKEYYPRGVVVRDGSQSHSLTWPVSQDAQEKEDGCARFLREARKMAKIGSIPGIVRVIDIFTENDTSYIIMDYLEGVTLRQYIKSNGLMSFARCMELFRPLFGAIGEMHGKGMIHRDISPDNIMIRNNGTVWLLDFGAAKDMGGTAGGESSVVVARSGFSPLEQYSGKNIGPWTDVYALCATLYYCVTGRTLPDASELAQGGSSIQWEEAQASEDIRIRAAIQDGLSMRYSDRIQNVPELVRRLEEVVLPEEEKQEEERGRQTEVVTDTGRGDGYSVSIDPITEETSRQKRKGLVKKVPIIAAAALILIVAAVFAYSRLGSGTVTEEDPDKSETSDTAAEVETDAEVETVENRYFVFDNGGPGAYSGEWRDDKPNGYGTAEFSDGGKYEGDWKDGAMDGQGVMTYASGSVYDGEWVNGLRDGQGKITYTNGNTYEGGWKDDLRDGHGVVVRTNGETFEADWVKGEQVEAYVTNRSFTDSYGGTYTYTGEVSGGKPNGTGTGVYTDGTYTGTWKNGDMNGKGTYTWTTGSKYVGEYKDGLRNGTGTYTTSNGDKYEGEWKNGESDGYGVSVSASGNKYEGEWKNSERDGKGTFTWAASGNKYEGEWKDGKRNGQGAFTWAASGNKYEGEWKDGKRSGQGAFTWADGRKYVGEFKDDQRDGQGTMTWADGRRYEGEFKNDKMDGQGVFYNADGSVNKSGTWKDDEFVSG